ncbi:MAG: HPr family phosphocarrier protein [Candidatus Hydrothermota bacterium]|uniref:HPr family phosphocarrier protein n=1 Tax=candidate division WOR-3 bacterium TaxID=2052148 RepID=A0A7C0X9H8_UNCW3|nr:MAG: HPr family phosphocarrier protein [Candidatus Hydrothermae bacterium]RKZ00266.1 MAG: HPr family phosphocarrier protein [Candidatus Hydrothermae bacterium]HDM90401.1 HPr family phosphocarrier protein [candidate division WOR-3 bacterium]
MIEKKVKIVNTLGLHARPASLFAKTAEKFISDITVEKDGMEVDGKSILGLMMLVADKNSTLTIRASGPDEKEAVEALAKLVEEGFGED